MKREKIFYLVFASSCVSLTLSIAYTSGVTDGLCNFIGCVPTPIQWIVLLFLIIISSIFIYLYSRSD